MGWLVYVTLALPIFLRQAALSDLLGVSMSFKHMFSVEKVDWKRDFIQDHFSPCCVFSDTIELSNNEWVGYDFMSQKNIQLPSIQWLTAGFECDTVSGLNRFSTAKSSCISEDRRTLRTMGLMFWWVIVCGCWWVQCVYIWVPAGCSV